MTSMFSGHATYGGKFLRETSQGHGPQTPNLKSKWLIETTAKATPLKSSCSTGRPAWARSAGKGLWRPQGISFLGHSLWLLRAPLDLCLSTYGLLPWKSPGAQLNSPTQTVSRNNVTVLLRLLGIERYHGRDERRVWNSALEIPLWRDAEWQSGWNYSLRSQVTWV